MMDYGTALGLCGIGLIIWLLFFMIVCAVAMGGLGLDDDGFNVAICAFIAFIAMMFILAGILSSPPPTVPIPVHHVIHK